MDSHYQKLPEDMLPEARATEATYGEVPKILCCMCGTGINPNPSNMCLECLRGTVDISEGLSKEVTITWCRACERYLQPPKYWVKYELESKELLTLCLKRIKGLNKLHLVDANWIWTEPHSRRLKIKLTIQKEIFQGTVIQQGQVVEYIVNAIQCENCAKIATGQEQWVCVVQLRQRVEHKRMLLYMEQLVLKHGMHLDCLKIQSEPDGLDFFYDARSPALKLVTFFNSLAPTRRVDAEQLVSSDLKNNTANFHYSHRLEIAPICREDIVCLPKLHYKALGGIGPIVLVVKIFSNIVIIDPRTLAAQEIAAPHYWKHPFQALATSRVLTQYYVIDVERIPGQTNGKYQLADITVCREDELGMGNEIIVRSHLGNVLREGDSAMGYDIERINFNNDDIEKYPQDTLPQIILVRKHYENQARRRRRRKWAIKQLPKVQGFNPTKAQEAKEALAMDDFLDELERDEDYRRNVALYRKQPDAMTTTTFGENDEEARVGIDELLDGLEDEVALGVGNNGGDDDDDSDE
eukprot:TRINITY_DN32666_c0_g1_i1.p1 TRINITY_DN32666_c0_g1~~TRINITY_DN32666_c0_g1_i1.p1  ORF type:complete len:523 (+),score=234.11 TRINITY_DN32666_c0_g1_i1:55-1623(+)